MASCNPCGNKKIYIADIADATDMGPGANVPSGVYRADAGGLQLDGKPAASARYTPLAWLAPGPISVASAMSAM